MNKREILIPAGTRFGRWVVGERVSVGRYNCCCDCGTTGIRAGKDLRTGHTRSCGCRTIDRITKHNLWHQYKSEYWTWWHAVRRCTVPTDSMFSQYGGRGITICSRWLDFPAFLADMGPRPSKELSLDRIDNNGPYCKENCRWATRSQQQRNKRTTKLTYAQAEQIKSEYAPGRITYQRLADKYGVTLSHIYNIVNRRNWATD